MHARTHARMHARTHARPCKHARHLLPTHEHASDTLHAHTGARSPSLPPTLHPPTQALPAMSSQQQAPQQHPDPSTTLPALPTELLTTILAHATYPHHLRNALRCCKALHALKGSTELKAQWLAHQRPRTALLQAAGAGDEALLLRLLRGSGAQVAAGLAECDGAGNTPLHLCSAAGLAEGVAHLARVPGVDVNAENCIGSTPLHLAVEKGQVGVVQVLVEVASVNLCAQEPKLGYTALHLAVLSPSEHNESMVQLLCNVEESGVALGDFSDSMPLHWAVNKGAPYMVELLLCALGGAAVLTRREAGYGQNVLHIACLHGNARIAAMLLRHPEVIESVNVLSGEGHSALMVACIKGHSSCVQVLYEAAGDALVVNGVDGFGFTPLQLACNKSHAAVVRELLLRFGGRLDLNVIGASPEKMTPLLIVCKRDCSGIVHLLLKASTGLTGPVDVGIRNEDGECVWDVLRGRGKMGGKCRAVLALHGVVEPVGMDESDDEDEESD